MYFYEYILGESKYYYFSEWYSFDWSF